MIADFKPVGNVVRGGERERAVDLQIERDRQFFADRMHGDMMHGEAAIARDHHHAVEDGLVVERARLGDHADLRLRQFRADRLDDGLLQRRDAVDRHGAADRDVELDELIGSDLPHAHAVDRDHAGHAPRDARDLVRDAGRRGVEQGVDGAAAEPPAGEQDEDRDHKRGGGIRPFQSERDAGKADEHARATTTDRS